VKRRCWLAGASHPRGVTRLAVLAAILLIGAATLVGQSAPLTVLKAAFLFNFANFSDWPADHLLPGQALSLCVIGDGAVADALSETIRGRTVKGHELTVEVLKADGNIRACHLLYASGFDTSVIAQLVQVLRGAAVLTVSDSDKFAESGGVAQLIVENDRMRFAINPAAATRARIRLSSKLLNLARMVKDAADVQR
jgi:hypothetical protein